MARYRFQLIAIHDKDANDANDASRSILRLFHVFFFYFAVRSPQTAKLCVITVTSTLARFSSLFAATLLGLYRFFHPHCHKPSLALLFTFAKNAILFAVIFQQ